MSTSCKGCTKRYLGCHAVCDAYREFKSEIQKARENKNRMGTYFDYARRSQTKQIRYALTHR